jgi:hypothetical protein
MSAPASCRSPYGPRNAANAVNAVLTQECHCDGCQVSLVSDRPVAHRRLQAHHVPLQPPHSHPRICSLLSPPLNHPARTLPPPAHTQQDWSENLRRAASDAAAAAGGGGVSLPATPWLRSQARRARLGQIRPDRLALLAAHGVLSPPPAGRRPAAAAAARYPAQRLMEGGGPMPPPPVLRAGWPACAAEAAALPVTACRLAAAAVA